MFGWWKRRGDLQARATALHAALVAEARAPHLYAGLHVPDTTDGRLEMLVLHMVLTLDRLVRMEPDNSEPGAAMARALTEAYVVAMDDTMRAIGVGDLAVPRKVKKAAAALYDRHRAYGGPIAMSLAAMGSAEAAAAWHATLREALQDVPGTAAVDVVALAHYAAQRVAALANVPDAALLAGRLAP